MAWSPVMHIRTARSMITTRIYTDAICILDDITDGLLTERVILISVGWLYPKVIESYGFPIVSLQTYRFAEFKRRCVYVARLE